jgi:hypothetical protein
MEESLELLQQLVSSNRPTSKATGYAVSIRNRVGQFVRQQRDRGVPWSTLSQALGVSHASLRTWMHAAPVAPVFLPVHIHHQAEIAQPTPLVITSPAGWRIEGVTLDQIKDIISVMT